MTLVNAEGENYQFRLSRAERAVLCALLKKYPLIPLSHHRLTRAPAAQESANQMLLEEVMSSQRTDFKERVRQLVSSRERFQPEANLFRVTFSREEMEWLLQVLNDVRVGSWILLGCPDPDEGRPPRRLPGHDRAEVDMELAAHFEWRLLEALHGPVDHDPDARHSG